jgi:hypothetical protein
MDLGLSEDHFSRPVVRFGVWEGRELGPEVLENTSFPDRPSPRWQSYVLPDTVS